MRCKTWKKLKKTIMSIKTILLTKANVAQTEDALSYYKARGLYFLAVVFVRRIVIVSYVAKCDILFLNMIIIGKIPLIRCQEARCYIIELRVQQTLPRTAANYGF